MDSGWAVVMGAAIALVGSSIIPWIRDTAAERSARTLAQQQYLRDAVIEMLTADAAHLSNLLADMTGSLIDSFTDRERAVAKVLMHVQGDERGALADLFRRSMPNIDDPRGRMHDALQIVLTAWAAGELHGDVVIEEWLAQIAALKSASS